NVFDIMQGVAITIFVKTGKKKTNELGKVFHYDLYGKREMKYEFLSEMDLKSIDFFKLNYNKPYYFFVRKNDDGRNDFENGFRVNEIFNSFTSGMVTANDALTIFNTKEELAYQTEKILSSVNPFTEFGIKDSRRIPKEGRIEDLKAAKAKGIMKINFRPFDVRFMYKFEKNEHWINSPRTDIMRHFINSENIGLVVSRQCADDWKYILCTKDANDFNLTGTAGRYGSGYTFPLYLYSETNAQQTIDQSTERTPNLNLEIVNQIAEKLGLTFTNEPFDSAQGSDAHHTEADRMEAEHLEAERSRSFHHHTEAEHLEAERSRSFHHHTEADRTEAERSRSFPHATETDRTEADHTEAERSRSFHHHSEADRLEAERSRSFPHPTEADRMEAEHLEAERSRSFDHRTEAERSRSFAPIDILDYIYAVLHSPTYREKYKEFLKIDFPRVPYPKDKNTFWQLVKLGGEIRQIHLLESPIVEKFITQYPIDGDNVVIKPRFISASLNDISASPNISSSLNDISASLNDNGKVYINDTQYFDNVPEIAWNFYIGGYQPAQKWLKDRKDRKLEFEDILHYQKIIVALTETDRLMKEIDKIEIE
ncbi:MAG: hypothetical protein M0P38_08895, partial [Bacteroidales bacterium]|nr:hypothetical protein [Bacteroidales bacterium]